MDIKTFSLAVFALLGWGLGSFVAKLATRRIGEVSVFWDLIGYAPVILIYSLLAFKTKDLFQADKVGIVLALIAGMLGVMGVVSFYILLTKKDASMVVPMTALYPALTAVLAVMFLKEPLTLIKGIGLLLSVVSLVLLSV